MLRCAKCGTLNADDHVYCKACGNRVSIEHEEALRLERQGKIEQAIESFEKALEMDTENEQLAFELALAYYHAGRLDDAVTQLEKVVEMSPEFADAHFQLGICYSRKCLFEKAIKVIRLHRGICRGGSGSLLVAQRCHREPFLGGSQQTHESPRL